MALAVTTSHHRPLLTQPVHVARRNCAHPVMKGKFPSTEIAGWIVNKGCHVFCSFGEGHFYVNDSCRLCDGEGNELGILWPDWTDAIKGDHSAKEVVFYFKEPKSIGKDYRDNDSLRNGEKGIPPWKWWILQTPTTCLWHWYTTKLKSTTSKEQVFFQRLAESLDISLEKGMWSEWLQNREAVSVFIDVWQKQIKAMCDAMEDEPSHPAPHLVPHPPKKQKEQKVPDPKPKSNKVQKDILKTMDRVKGSGIAAFQEAVHLADKQLSERGLDTKVIDEHVIDVPGYLGKPITEEEAEDYGPVLNDEVVDGQLVHSPANGELVLAFLQEAASLDQWLVTSVEKGDGYESRSVGKEIVGWWSAKVESSHMVTAHERRYTVMFEDGCRKDNMPSSLIRAMQKKVDESKKQQEEEEEQEEEMGMSEGEQEEEMGMSEDSEEEEIWDAELGRGGMVVQEWVWWREHNTDRSKPQIEKKPDCITISAPSAVTESFNTYVTTSKLADDEFVKVADTKCLGFQMLLGGTATVVVVKNNMDQEMANEIGKMCKGKQKAFLSSMEVSASALDGKQHVFMTDLLAEETLKERCNAIKKTSSEDLVSMFGSLVSTKQSASAGTAHADLDASVLRMLVHHVRSAEDNASGVFAHHVLTVFDNLEPTVLMLSIYEPVSLKQHVIMVPAHSSVIVPSHFLYNTSANLYDDTWLHHYLVCRKEHVTKMRGVSKLQTTGFESYFVTEDLRPALFYCVNKSGSRLLSNSCVLNTIARSVKDKSPVFSEMPADFLLSVGVFVRHHTHFPCSSKSIATKPVMYTGPVDDLHGFLLQTVDAIMHKVDGAFEDITMTLCLVQTHDAGKFRSEGVPHIDLTENAECLTWDKLFAVFGIGLFLSNFTLLVDYKPIKCEGATTVDMRQVQDVASTGSGKAPASIPFHYHIATSDAAKVAPTVPNALDVLNLVLGDGDVTITAFKEGVGVGHVTVGIETTFVLFEGDGNDRFIECTAKGPKAKQEALDEALSASTYPYMFFDEIEVLKGGESTRLSVFSVLDALIKDSNP